MPHREAQRFERLLAELMAAIHRHSAGETLHIMSEAGLTLPQMVAMQRLHHGGACTVTGLGEALRLSPSATSHLVERLVERGFVARSEDPVDRRQKRVEIAEGGRALLDRLNASRLVELEGALGALRPGSAELLFHVIERVIAELDAPKEKS